MREQKKVLTIRDPSPFLILQAKAMTGKATGSQAFIAGIELTIRQSEQIADMRDDNRKLREQLQIAQGLLRQIAPMCVQVAELAGQKDWLFDDCGIN